MAIARGAGTEIIRSIHAEAVNSTAQILIYGTQHHIYTVLSIIAFASSMATQGNEIICLLVGFDSKAGTTAENNHIFRQAMNDSQTYVWNDKFSFNGAEPANYTGPMNSAADQNLIADQASTPVSQYLQITSGNASDNVDVTCTFIDQNNE